MTADDHLLTVYGQSAKTPPKREDVSVKKAKSVWIVAAVVLALPAYGADKSDRHQGETLVRQAPPGFKSVFSETRNGTSVREFVPKTDSLKNWTSMVTIQSFKSGPDLKPGKFLVEFGEKYAALCPALSHTNILNGSANGYKVSLLAIQCPQNPTTGKPENLYVRAIKGDYSFYSIQYSYDHPLTPDEKTTLGEYLESVIVCDVRKPEHPCPAN